MELNIGGYSVSPNFLENERYIGLLPSEKQVFNKIFNLYRISIKNANKGWRDKDGQIFCSCSLENLANALYLSAKTISRAITGLSKHGLIKTKRVGLTRANRIYVCLPEDVESLKPPKIKIKTTKKERLEIRRKAEAEYFSERTKTTFKSSQKGNDLNGQNGEHIQKEIKRSNNTHKCINDKSQSESDANEKKIEDNMTETISNDDLRAQFINSFNEIAAKLSKCERELADLRAERANQPIALPVVSVCPMSQQNAPRKYKHRTTSLSAPNNQSAFNEKFEEVKALMNYKHHVYAVNLETFQIDETRMTQSGKLFHDLCRIIAEISTMPPEKTTYINGQPHLIKEVQSVYQQLTDAHLTRVIERFEDQKHKINNINAYLKVALYNVLNELESKNTNKPTYDFEKILLDEKIENAQINEISHSLQKNAEQKLIEPECPKEEQEENPIQPINVQKLKEQHELLWEKTLDFLKRAFSKVVFESMIKPIIPVSLENNTLILSTQNFLDTIKTRYLGEIRRSLRMISEIDYEVIVIGENLETDKISRSFQEIDEQKPMTEPKHPTEEEKQEEPIERVNIPFWEEALKLLERSFSETIFTNFINLLIPISLNKNALTLSANSANEIIISEINKTRWLNEIRRCVRAVSGVDYDVIVTTKELLESEQNANN